MIMLSFLEETFVFMALKEDWIDGIFYIYPMQKPCSVGVMTSSRLGGLRRRLVTFLSWHNGHNGFGRNPFIDALFFPLHTCEYTF